MTPKPLIVFNTLSRQKEVFTPRDADCVRVYICGPTVYHRIHIGNARSAVVFDIVNRVLRHLFPKVLYVRNLTDVDDKINAAAASRGISIRELTEETTRYFHEDVAALYTLPPDIEPRATEHIGDMIGVIQALLEKGHAYTHEEHVLFDVKSFPTYGHLSRMPLDEIQQGARVEVAPYKKNPEDFVLWKPSPDDIPGWPSPWGRGRPGWHIECSAMSARYLGPVFDIHGGGEDLIFPHHENEIAQSCAASGLAHFAMYWLHNGMLIVEGQKMSKSLGNFVLLSDVLEQHAGEVVRWALLSSHYRQMLNWTDTLLHQARACVDSVYQALLPWEGTYSQDACISPRVLDALRDDFNTPSALAEIQALAHELNKKGSAQEASELMASAQLLGFCNQTPTDWFRALPATSTLSEDQIESLITERKKARSVGDYAHADRIRGDLLAKGITLEDRPDGSASWKRAR